MVHLQYHLKYIVYIYIYKQIQGYNESNKEYLLYDIKFLNTLQKFFLELLKSTLESHKIIITHICYFSLLINGHL